MEYLATIITIPVLCLLVALYIRKDMAVWLAIVSMSGAIVALSDVQPWQALLFFCGANLISAAIAYSHFSTTKLLLPIVIGITYSLEVMLSCLHIIVFSMTTEIQPMIGMTTGVIGVLQLALVLFMDDKRGPLVGIFSSMRNLVVRDLHDTGNS